MLIYPNRCRSRLVFSRYGSVVFGPWNVTIGVVVTLVTAFLHYLREIDSEWAPKIRHFYGGHAFVFFLSMATVFRNNVSWSRYWEAVTQVQFMYSKWADAYLQMFAFSSVTVQRAMAVGTPDANARAKRLDTIVTRMLCNFSLMSALAADRLLHGDTQQMERIARTRGSWKNQVARSGDLRESGLDDQTSRMGLWSQVQLSLGVTGATRASQPQKYLRYSRKSYKLDFALSDEEWRSLEVSSDRMGVVMQWIIHDIALASHDLDIAPPIQTRVYQELSNGMLGFTQAQKIADVPLPFPYVQCLTMLIIGFVMFIPVYITCFTDSSVASPLLANLLFQGFWGINESAIELENPFGTEVNKVNVLDQHARFTELCQEVLQDHKAKKEAAKDFQDGVFAKHSGHTVDLGLQEFYKECLEEWERADELGEMLCKQNAQIHLHERSPNERSTSFPDAESTVFAEGCMSTVCAVDHDVDSTARPRTSATSQARGQDFPRLGDANIVGRIRMSVVGRVTSPSQCPCEFGAEAPGFPR